MMLDAPGGWGIGKSGTAWMQWYQPLDHHEIYRTLVNSHLTWLTEFGWSFRFFYIFAWIAIFLLCWPTREASWMAVCFGSWLAFAVGAFFSSVAESGWLWIAPAAALLVIISYRVRRCQWPQKQYWLIPLGGTAFACIVLFIIGSAQSSLVHKSEGRIVFGRGSPNTWILVDTKIIGKTYGRALREYAKTNPLICAGFAEDALQLPDMSGKELVMTGKPLHYKETAEVFKSAASVMLINPGFFPAEIEKPAATNLTLLMGEFSQSPAREAWGKLFNAQLLSGVGDFLPNWPSKVFSNNQMRQ